MTLRELLNEIKDDLLTVDGDLQPPASAAEVRKLRQRVSQELACEIPDEYSKFLRTTNGLSWSGLALYATSQIPIVGHHDRFIAGIVEANKAFRQNSPLLESYLILGDDGDSLFGYHTSKQTYELFTPLMTSLDEFDTFAEMVCRLIEEQL